MRQQPPGREVLKGHLGHCPASSQPARPPFSRPDHLTGLCLLKGKTTCADTLSQHTCSAIYVEIWGRETAPQSLAGRSPESGSLHNLSIYREAEMQETLHSPPSALCLQPAFSRSRRPVRVCLAAVWIVSHWHTLQKCYTTGDMFTTLGVTIIRFPVHFYSYSTSSC